MAMPYVKYILELGRGCVVAVDFRAGNCGGARRTESSSLQMM
jgi:hypothetical protein